MGDTGHDPHRSLVHLPRISLQEHMDVYHSPLCTERVLRLLGAGGRVGVGLEAVSMGNTPVLKEQHHSGWGSYYAPALPVALIHPSP